MAVIDGTYSMPKADTKFASGVSRHGRPSDQPATLPLEESSSKRHKGLFKPKNYRDLALEIQAPVGEPPTLPKGALRRI